MLDPILIIKTVGMIGIVAIIFAETGLFFGFFFPGDSLLFTAGIIASQGFLSIWPLLILCVIAAIFGDTVGYWTGKKFGRKLFEKEDGFLFKKRYLTDTENFYEKHGKFTIVISRFVPIVRTFAPIVAGIGKMNYLTFLSYNISGGLFWVVLMLLSGYYLGGMITDPDKYIIPIIFGIILVSFLPVIWKIVRHRIKKKD